MKKYQTITLFLLDILVLLGSLGLVLFIRENTTLGFLAPFTRTTNKMILWQIILFSMPLYLMIHYILGTYQKSLKNRFLQIIINSLFSNGFLFVVLTLVLFFVPIKNLSRSALILTLCLNSLVFILVHSLFKYFISVSNPSKVLVVGSGKGVEYFLKELRRFKDVKISISGVATPKSGENKVYIYPIVCDYNNLSNFLSNSQVDAVFIVSDNPQEKNLILNQINYDHYKDSEIYISPTPYEILISGPNYIRIHDIPMLRVNKRIPWTYNLKRIFDAFFSLLLLIFSFPLLFTVFLMVKMTSKGPGLFKQARIGRFDKKFVILKFRTMYYNQNVPVYQAKKNGVDSRITKIGHFLRKSRLDELPQLVNILKGDMSFIGPRPLVENEVELFVKEIPFFKERFMAYPGVTGLAQVHGDYHTIAEHKIKYDLWYIYHYSLRLDFGILFRTLKTVILRQGS